MKIVKYFLFFPNNFNFSFNIKMLQEVVEGATDVPGRGVELTVRQLDILVRGACLDYTGPYRGQTAIDLGISRVTVNNHAANIHQKFGTMDIFSTVYIALQRGILSIDKLTSRDYSELEETLERLSPREKETLVMRGMCASKYGRSDWGFVSEVSEINQYTLKNRMQKIRGKIGYLNLAQMAVMAYICAESISNPQNL